MDRSKIVTLCRLIIITSFLIPSVPMEALSSDCAGAGTVFRIQCPGEKLIDCLYDESQCSILNVDPSFYNVTKWERKQISWAGTSEIVNLNGTGKCASVHDCDGNYAASIEYPRFFPPVITGSTWSQTAKNRTLNCTYTTCPIGSYAGARRSCAGIDADGSDIAASYGTCSYIACGSCGLPPEAESDCDACLGWWVQNGEGNYCCYTDTPIVIDTQGNGFNLTNAANGVSFDINNDGIQEQVSWTYAGSDDAWLVLDRNGNGTIDNGSELFGNATAQPPSEHKNGFLALGKYDESANGGDSDGKITHLDGVYASLRLWRDTNHNGISEASELRSLASQQIAAIDLDYKTSKRTDENGNLFRYKAKVWDGQGASVGRWAWDVFLTRE